MNTLEHQLDYVFGDALPAPGDVLEVAPGVLWLRMPLPFALDHINLWLLRDRIDGRDGWTAIDCGITDDVVKAHWETLFDRCLDGLPILRVLATHCHPDHLGLAHWLCDGGARRRWHAPLWMTLGEYATGLTWSSGAAEGSNAGGNAAADHFARHGLRDAETLARIRARRDYYATLVPALPPFYYRLRDGDTVTIGARDWRIVAGFGHSPEHGALCCAEARLLISGDMVLPRISTNVSVSAQEPDGDPLALYLDSLGRYDALPEDTLTLPSHGRPFRGLHRRLAQLREHHAARLDEVRRACGDAPRSAADVLPLLFRRALDLHQTTFAMGEALAHLHRLWYEGSLVRSEDADGIIRFAVP